MRHVAHESTHLSTALPNSFLSIHRILDISVPLVDKLLTSSLADAVREIRADRLIEIQA